MIRNKIWLLTNQNETKRNFAFFAARIKKNFAKQFFVSLCFVFREIKNWCEMVTLIRWGWGSNITLQSLLKYSLFTSSHHNFSLHPCIQKCWAQIFKAHETPSEEETGKIIKWKRKQNCELTERKTENCRFWGYRNLGSVHKHIFFYRYSDFIISHLPSHTFIGFQKMFCLK
jgi:hypothetical protein